MITNLTIVAYHYVREIKNSKYPKIKGLEFSIFKNQLDFLERKFNIISAEQLVAYLIGEEKVIPVNPCLLTFDDGYKDHITFVHSELSKRKISGCFFPVASSIIDKVVLDVHAIQFILACTKDIKNLIKDIISKCDEYKINKRIIENVWKSTKKGIYDKKEIVFIKKILQQTIPIKNRPIIIKSLFEKYVDEPLDDFSKQLYMSSNELVSLIQDKMYIGNHTYNHYWLNTLNIKDQNIEIEKSLKFLKSIKAPIKNWIMCFPYGAYNNNTLKILKKKKCLIGLTTKSGESDLKNDNLLKLNRFDTNHFL